MEFRTLGQIIVDVLEAREWFEEIGISTSGTRLEEIDRYLHELLNPTDPRANPFSSDPNGPDAYHALSDAAGFGRIALQFKSISSSTLPRRALKDALTGSFKLSAEPAGATEDGRNKFVELEFAAYCLESGVSVIGFDDVRLNFQGYRYIVECKRPLHPGTLEQNVSKAYGQLRSRLGENDRGIIAVALDKAFGLDGVFQEANTLEDFSNIAVSVAKKFGGSVASLTRTWIDPRVVSIAGVIRFLAKSRYADTVAYSYQVGLVKLASEHEGQLADSDRLDRLASALRGESSGGA
jgi:hypothetical protein